MSGDPLGRELTQARLTAVHRATAEIVRRTPVLSTRSISERCGGTVALKAENLQRTGSFKLRGASATLLAVEESARGVVAASAGNHAQGLAYAARRAGVPCEVFMPRQASVSKVAAVAAFGAAIRQEGDTVEACVAAARERARESGMRFVHPFDDYDVIAGQAGVGLELAEDVPALRTVVVPVGGGGLAAGVAAALAQRRPGVRVVGVQASVCSPVAAALHAPDRGAGSVSTRTIADGIAVKQPGSRTLPLIERLLDDVVTVEEEAIAEAMIVLLERCKLVVEGAGAVAVAALVSGRVRPAASGETVAVLSGGNVDVGLLATIAAREETRAGRRVRLFTRVADLPGGLAGLLATIAQASGNVIHVEHVRDGVVLGVRESGIELTIEARGPAHAREVLQRIVTAGYEVAELG